MSEKDEEIIKELNAYKKETSGSIYTTIYIKEDQYKFIEFEVYKDKVSIYIPERFIDLPMDLARLKYPSENRPQIMKTSTDNQVNLLFNLLNVNVPETEVKNMRDTLKTLLKNSNPSNQFLEQGEYRIGEHTVAYFDFIGHVIDGKMYNLVSCIPIKDQLFHCVFNCPVDLMKLWKPVFVEMLQSIKCKEQGQEENK